MHVRRLLPVFLPLLNSVYAANASPRPYSIWMADSMLSRGVQPTRWYNEAFFSRAIEAVYNATSDTTYLDHLITHVDSILTPTGSIRDYILTDHQLDNIRVGSVILAVYNLHSSNAQSRSRYQAAADFLYDQLVNQQKRTPSGGYWHKDRYPNQMWLDGLYMAEPFRAHYETLFHGGGSRESWDDIVLQFDLVEEHCRNSTSGLLHHGYDESRTAAWVANQTTGTSAHVWDRAQGWYLMAIVDLLDWFPASHPGYDRLLGYLTSLAEGLKKAQETKSGGWWLVMDEPWPGKEGNYIESSGTAMYVYGLLKGVRKGYIRGAVFGEVVKRAYQGMVDKFVTLEKGKDRLNWEGTVRVGSLDGLGDYKYYTTVPIVQNSLLGVSPFILASVEMEAYNNRR